MHAASAPRRAHDLGAGGQAATTASAMTAAIAWRYLVMRSSYFHDTILDDPKGDIYACFRRLRCCGGLRSPVSRCVEMMFAIGAMCAAGLSQQTLSSTGLDADMEKLNEYIQADKTNEQSVETLYADLQHRFSVMKVRLDTLSTPTHPSAYL